MCFFYCFFFKQKTAYEMRISDWSSDVCSSDLARSDPADQRHALAGPDRETDAVERLLGGVGIAELDIAQVDPAFEASGLQRFALRAFGGLFLHRVELSIGGEHPLGRASCWESVCQFV